MNNEELTKKKRQPTKEDISKQAEEWTTELEELLQNNHSEINNASELVASITNILENLHDLSRIRNSTDIDFEKPFKQALLKQELVALSGLILFVLSFTYIVAQNPLSPESIINQDFLPYIIGGFGVYMALFAILYIRNTIRRKKLNKQAGPYQLSEYQEVTSRYYALRNRIYKVLNPNEVVSNLSVEKQVAQSETELNQPYIQSSGKA